MKHEIEVYAVISSYGKYEDYHEKYERVFTSRSAAEKLAEEIDKSHETHNEISGEDWDTILDAFRDFYQAKMEVLCKEAGIPSKSIELNEDDYEACDKWYDLHSMVNDMFPEWGRQYTVSHFDGKYTAENFDHTDDHYNTDWEEWHPTRVRPIILEIDDGFKIPE